MDFIALAERLLQMLGRRGEVLAALVHPAFRAAFENAFVMPTSGQLATILREAFYATLLTYEGLPTRFVVSLIPRGNEPQTASGEVVLAESLPLTRANIRRLAPAAPLERALLRLQLRDDGVAIESIMSFAAHFGRPVALSVAGQRPGVLAVSFNNQRLLLVEGDSVTALDGAARYMDPDQAKLCLAQHLTDGSYQSRTILAGVVWAAVAELRRTHKGGAFWFLPSGLAAGFEGSIERVRGEGELFAPLRDIERRAIAGPEVLPDARTLAAINLLRDAETDAISGTLASLAATDGAVLLTSEPRLVGFGSFVHSKPPSQIRRRAAGETLTIAAEEAGGGRHRSAAAFCSAGKPGDRAALVVSHDGTATLFFSVPPGVGALGILGAGEGVFAVRVEAVGRGFAADE